MANKAKKKKKINLVKSCKRKLFFFICEINKLRNSKKKKKIKNQINQNGKK